MAIVAALAAILVPAIPFGTSRTTLEAYAVRTAAVLKQDHAFAQAARRDIATGIDLNGHVVRSGATGTAIIVPPDVAMGAILARRCRGQEVGAAIVFLASGMSCGGTVTLTRLGTVLQIRVNWLTGGVEIVSEPAA